MSIYRLQPSAIRCPAPVGLPLLVHFVGRYFAEATPLKSLGNGSARPGQTEGIHRWCDPIERGAQSPFQAGTEGSNLAPLQRGVICEPMFYKIVAEFLAVLANGLSQPAALI